MGFDLVGFPSCHCLKEPLLEEKTLVRVIKSMVLILTNKIGLVIHSRKDLERHVSCLVPKRLVDQ